MKQYIQRYNYLQKLIDRRNNGEIKVITGSRRCGKSWLLSKIYFDWLVSNGVAQDNIISITFDTDDIDDTGDLTNPEELKAYLRSRIVSESEDYYIFLDEIQEVEGFEKIVNGLNKKDNVDVYVTGSNSKFLSSDINTLFRGRGDEVRLYPLSFSEFCENRTEPRQELWKEYYTFGGMPGLLGHKKAEEKTAYLQRLWTKTYIDDVVERHNVKNRQAFESLVDMLCSSIGSLTNPTKIANTINSLQHIKVDSETINTYLGYLQESYLFEAAKRYNIKGKRYFESIKKYYSVDLGLRNARLNYRQQEITHIMENVVFNHLCMRGYKVDVGVIEKREMTNGKSQYKQYEVDFIATNGIEKYYIQSAYALPDESKREQELASLKRIDDSFQKVIIVGDDIMTYTDDNGFVFMGLFQFLSNEKVLS
ncbi:ATP-binding protein [Sodaliphilus sp.]|uniref:ATP-binding protein n=1 Tax=Sodaliphilus sp. TaxID=2815818 RepID=UPI00388E65A3